MRKNTEVLTTGHVADILAVAPRTVTSLIDSRLLKGGNLPESKDRRVKLTDLVDFIKEYNFPKHRLFRFLEDANATPARLEELSIKEPIGNKNIHFYPEIPHYPEKPDILTTADVAKLGYCSPRTIAKWTNSGKLNGWRIPHGGYCRRITVDDFVRFYYKPDEEIPKELEKITTLSINYPSGWKDLHKLISQENKSLWYRENENIQEISIRCGNDGLYVKVKKATEGKDATCDLILIGMTGRGDFGKFVHDEHLKQIYTYLLKGIELSNNLMDKNAKPDMKEALGCSKRQFERYMLVSKSNY